MNCTLPDNSVHGILQERIQEWVAILFSRGYFQPKDWTQVSWIAGSFLNKSEPSGKPFFKDYWCGISLWIMEIFSTHLGKTGLVHSCCSVAQLCPLVATPWTAACQASLSITISKRWLNGHESIQMEMTSKHLVLCCPLLLLPLFFPSIRIFST